MDSLDPMKLEALLDLLTTAGVEEFEGYGFHVRFSSVLFSSGRSVDSEPAQVEVRHSPEPAPVSVWEDQHLWPGGKPPRFPGSDLK